MRTDAFNFLSPIEAAEVLGVCPATLFNWRAQSEGPAYVRLGGRIRYPRFELDAYVASQTTHRGQREAALVPNQEVA